ncbi:tonB-system energizer ExbB [Jiella sp. 40Bstr34]|uniref:Biopolymer transport protein ExbB n=2 Tax=Jiella pacifica TaxID=2696469 RepID=A0A6N9T4X8_9HYPH|nr:tonB-system energizer ExbB [Jiella pacifica]
MLFLALSLSAHGGLAVAQEPASPTPGAEAPSQTQGRVVPGESGAPRANAPETPAPAEAAPADAAAEDAGPAAPAGNADSPAASASPAQDTPSNGVAAAPGSVPAGNGEAASTGGERAAGSPASGGEPVLFQEPRDAKLPHDLSPWGMFMAADWVVKGVMIALALASLATWTILLVKGFEVFGAKWRARSGVKRLARADSLEAAIGDERNAARWRGPVGALARSAAHEWRRSGELSAEGVKERVAMALGRIEANASRSLNRGTGILATVGSIAPFVGLFGTVWGIMNSFIGISEANTTNLAVVAPGIAEALLATAIGLVAAIPAVVVYNVFARSIAGYRAILSDASALVLQHLSRDLERRTASRHGAVPLAQAAE